MSNRLNYLNYITEFSRALLVLTPLHIYDWKNKSKSECSSSQRSNDDLPKSFHINSFTNDANPDKWILEYDYYFKNPKWTYEYLVKDKNNLTSSVVDRKRSKFFADQTLNADLKVLLLTLSLVLVTLFLLL